MQRTRQQGGGLEGGGAGGDSSSSSGANDSGMQRGGLSASGLLAKWDDARKKLQVGQVHSSEIEASFSSVCWWQRVQNGNDSPPKALVCAICSALLPLLPSTDRLLRALAYHACRRRGCLSGGGGRRRF